VLGGVNLILAKVFAYLEPDFGRKVGDALPEARRVGVASAVRARTGVGWQLLWDGRATENLEVSIYI
jgi:hypothetical protein